GPPKPKWPRKAECNSLHDEAAKQLAIAADYIEKCGYHRRDEELAELRAVIKGKRAYADLPPRVQYKEIFGERPLCRREPDGCAAVHDRSRHAGALSRLDAARKSLF